MNKLKKTSFDVILTSFLPHKSLLGLILGVYIGLPIGLYPRRYAPGGERSEHGLTKEYERRTEHDSILTDEMTHRCAVSLTLPLLKMASSYRNMTRKVFIWHVWNYKHMLKMLSN